MANKLQTSIRAYAADNIQIKRFLKVNYEKVQTSQEGKKLDILGKI